MQLKLVCAISLVLCLCLLPVWPNWFRQGVFMITLYILVFLFLTVIIRVVVWLAFFHIGIDFWILPNYFRTPLFSFEQREDSFDIRMLILRIVSAIVITSGLQELMADPKKIDQLVLSSQKVWDELIDWSHQIDDYQTEVENQVEE